MSKTIGVLCGGNTIESEFSMAVGERVTGALKMLGLRARLIDIADDLCAHLKARDFDFAYIAVYGCPGQDGAIQGALDLFSLPYTGSGIHACAVAKHKPLSKECFLRHGIATPPYFLLNGECLPREDLRERIDAIGGWPVVVKPAIKGGSSLGVVIVDSFASLEAGMGIARDYDQEILVEAFVTGTEFTVPILEGMSPPLPPVLVERSYASASRPTIVARQQCNRSVLALDEAMTEALTSTAFAAFRTVGGEHSGYVDIIVDHQGKCHVIEVGLVPGLSGKSNLPISASSRGVPYEEVVRRSVMLGLSRSNMDIKEFTETCLPEVMHG